MKSEKIKINICLLTIGCIGLLVSCSDNNSGGGHDKPEGEKLPEEYYAGGELGTAFDASPYAYTMESPASEQQGFSQAFKVGELFFEKDFNTNENGAFKGLGPLYIRSGCMYCPHLTDTANVRRIIVRRRWATVICLYCMISRLTDTLLR